MHGPGLPLSAIRVRGGAAVSEHVRILPVHLHGVRVGHVWAWPDRVFGGIRYEVVRGAELRCVANASAPDMPTALKLGRSILAGSVRP